jgi:hypothetical protein
MKEGGTTLLDAVRVTTSMWFSDIRGLCDELITRPRKKKYIQKEDEKTKWISKMKTHSKRQKDLRMATWNVRSLYINKLREYKIAIAAIQEVN